MDHGWSLSKKHWNELAQIIKDTVWARSSLHHLYQDLIPETAGIYMICSKVKCITQDPFNKFYNVLYIGQANPLRRRFLEHCRNPQKEVHKAKQCFTIPLDYWYTTVPQEQLDRIETLLIDSLGPSANLQRGVIRGKICAPRHA